MTTATAAPDAVIHALPRALGLHDLVLCNIVAMFAMVSATVPPAGIEEPWLFRLKVIGGAGAFVLLGGAVYLRGRR